MKIIKAKNGVQYFIIDRFERIVRVCISEKEALKELEKIRKDLR